MLDSFILAFTYMLAMLPYTRKVWAVRLKPLIKQMNFYQSRLSVEMTSIMLPQHIHVTNGAIHNVSTQGSKQKRTSIVLVTSFFY